MYRRNTKLEGMLSFMIALTLMLALVSSTGVVQAQDTSSNAPLAALLIPENSQVVPDQYIVVYKSNNMAVNAEDSIRAAVAVNGGEVKFMYGAALNGYSAYLPEKALAAVRANPAVDYVEADAVIALSPEADDFNASTIQTGATWGLDRIDQHALPLSTTYTYNNNGTGVNVYIIDTGIRSTHTQFGGRATKDYDSVGDGQNGNDCAGHGTHVAGTIGGSTYGVAKNVKLHAVRVLNCAGSGSTSGVIAGINWVTAHHVHPAVANMSLGGGASASLDTATNSMINHGVVLAVAAGNDNANACNSSPARVPNAITTGATTSSDARAYFSNWGTCLDIFAPGYSITSAWIGSNTATNTISGTSMASPHVAGVAALYLQAHPSATVSTVRNAIVNASTKNKVTDVAGSANRLLYSLFGPPSPIPTLVAPKGTITDTTPAYKWTKVSGATQYRYQLMKGATTVYTKTVAASACATSNCTSTPATVLSYAAYKWRAQAMVGGVWKTYSPYANFTVSKPAVGFNSQFTSNAAGWSAVKGAWSILSPGYYRALGLVNYWSSIVHTGNYPTLDFQARVKRLGCSTCSNRLMIRGKTTPLSATYGWSSAYSFQYVNDKYFSVWKNVNGVSTEIKTWTYYASINPNGWNTLRVTAKNSTLKFYINGMLVWTGTDTSLTNGQVGIGMYRDAASTGNNFYVDWAKLGTSVASVNNETLAEVGESVINWDNPDMSPAR